MTGEEHTDARENVRETRASEASASTRLPNDREQERQLGAQQSDESDQPQTASIKEFVGELKVTDWITAVATVVIAAATIWNVWYVGDQLAEMRASGQDSKNLVAATQNLVTAYTTQEREISRLRGATEDFAKAMRDEANNTGKLVSQAQQSAGYSRQSAQAAQGQLAATEEGQRAQIVLTGWRASQSLTFKDGRAFLELEFDLKNSGHTIAKYTDAHVLFYLPKNKLVVHQQKETCAAQKPRIGDSPVGFNVGEGDTFALPYGVTMNADDVSRWGKVYSPTVQKVVPYVVGCIVYFSNDKPHHTPFVFEVDKKANTPAGFDHIDPTKGDIPADQLVFPTPPWYAGETD